MPGSSDAALPEELRRAFSTGGLIVCLGPEASVGAGLPSLGDLARALVDRAHEADPEIDAAALRVRVEAGRVAEVLQLVQRSLGAAFVREVQTRLSDQGMTPPPVLVALAARRKQLRAVYSVRMDRLLERALHGQWPSFAQARPDLAQRRGVVFKLLGTLELPDTWVLTQAQGQRALGAGAPRREVFATAFAAHQMLFVGFAPDDAELGQLLELAPAAEAGAGPGHFIVVPGCSAEDRTLLTGRGLQVIDAEALTVLEALGEATAEELPPVSVDASPYPGAAAFDEALAPAFFGRHADVSEAASRLGPGARWLSVEGPDGVGKTSFVHAGVIPALRRGFSDVAPERWIVATVPKRDDPEAALADALTRALGLDDRPSLVEALADSPERFVEYLHVHVPAEAALLLVVDPLEDLLTAPEGPRAAVAAALAEALRRKALFLVTTLQDAGAGTDRTLGALADRFGAAARHRLRALGRIGLRDAIVEPAALVGVRVEPQLADALLDDAAESVPVVARTMAGLWTQAVLADKVVTAAEYRATGGAAGAMRRHAEQCVQHLPAGDRDAAVALLVRLVHRDDDGALAARPMPLAQARSEAGAAIVNPLVDTGVLWVRAGSDGRTVELPHLDLLSQWPRLADALAPVPDAEIEPASAPPSAPPAAPTRTGRWALVAVAVVGLGGVVAAAALGGNDGVEGKTTSTDATATPDGAGDETTAAPAGDETEAASSGDADAAGRATDSGAGTAGSTSTNGGEPPPPEPEPEPEPKAKPTRCRFAAGDYSRQLKPAEYGSMTCKKDTRTAVHKPGCDVIYGCTKP